MSPSRHVPKFNFHQFSLISLLFLISIIAFATYRYTVAIEASPIPWKAYSDSRKREALEAGKPVVLWLRPRFTTESDAVLSRIDKPNVRKAISYTNAVALKLEFLSPNEPDVKKLIEETLSHPHHNAIVVFKPSGTMTSLSLDDLESGILRELYSKSK